MHARLTELLAYADRSRAELMALVEPLAPSQLQASGAEGSWSVAKHLAHLQMVESSSVRALFRAFRTARDAGLGMETESTSLVGALDGTDLVEGKVRLNAPEIVQPSEVPDFETLRMRMAESRAGLYKWAAEADGYALGTVHFPHPVFGQLNLYEWVAMIAGHEVRHMRHIRRIIGETGE